MAKKFKQLQFSVKNKVGELSRITNVLKTAEVNILHVSAWSEGAKGYFLMVTDDNAKAAKVLRQIGVSPKLSDVLVLTLSNKVGSLDRAAKKLANAKIDITCMSATSAGNRTSVVICTKNNDKASRVV